MKTAEKSISRVEDNTDKQINDRISEKTQMNVSYYAAHPEKISERLLELDREWDMERRLQFNSSVISLAGLLLSIGRGKKWLVLPIAVQSFFLQHGVQGWCPPIPMLRRLGVRTMHEIEAEKHALKALRGDFQELRDKDAATVLNAELADGAQRPAPQTQEKLPLLDFEIKTTSHRVPDNTLPEINERIREDLEKHVAFYATHPEAREKRLSELDYEWDIERIIEVEAPSVSLTGTIFGLLGSKAWLSVPLAVQTMMCIHALQGFYPLLPLFRRLGFRTEDEIATERYAIKAVRGDFEVPSEEQNVNVSQKADAAFNAANNLH